MTQELCQRQSQSVAHGIPDGGIQTGARRLAPIVLGGSGGTQVIVDRLRFQDRTADHQLRMSSQPLAAPGAIAPAGDPIIGAHFHERRGTRARPVQRPAEALAQIARQMVHPHLDDLHSGASSTKTGGAASALVTGGMMAATSRAAAIVSSESAHGAMRTRNSQQ